MQGYIRDSFADMGTDSLNVMIMGRGSSRSVSEEDMYALVDEHSDMLKAISPTVTMMSSVKIGSDTLTSTSATGVSEEYFSMKGYTVDQGRGLQYTDMKSRKKVCVVGEYLNQAYFGGSAVGQSIKIGGTTFTIVGVLAQQGSELEEGGSDDCIYLPYSTAARLSFTGTISSYVITVQDTDQITQAKALVEQELYSVFSDDSAYTVTSLSLIHISALRAWRWYPRCSPGRTWPRRPGSSGASPSGSPDKIQFLSQRGGSSAFAEEGGKFPVR